MAMAAAAGVYRAGLLLGRWEPMRRFAMQRLVNVFCRVPGNVRCYRELAKTTQARARSSKTWARADHIRVVRRLMDPSEGVAEGVPGASGRQGRLLKLKYPHGTSPTKIASAFVISRLTHAATNP